MLRMKRRVGVALMVLAVLACGVFVTASARADEEHAFSYTPYLSQGGSESLRFSPGPEDFSAMLDAIRSSAVTPPSDAALVTGMGVELQRLLTEATVGGAPAASLTLDPSVMTAVPPRYAPAIPPAVTGLALLEGLVRGLNDPGAALWLPADLQTRQEAAGTTAFGGIGVRIRADDARRGIVILVVLPGGPAAAGGVLPGDIITAIDGIATQGLSLDQATRLIRGPEGSTVTLTVERPGSAAGSSDISLVRAQVHASNLSSAMLNNKVGYLRIFTVSPTMGTELGAAARSLHAAGASRWILDLRNNSGGPMDALQAVGGALLGPHHSIGSQVGRDGAREEFETTGEQAFSGPMVVLVNKYTGSGAELLAAAVKVSRGAMLVGETTAGAGRLLTVIQLPGGASFQLTSGLLETAAGRPLDGVGLTPDEVVVMPISQTWTKKDRQYERAKAMMPSLR